MNKYIILIVLSFSIFLTTGFTMKEFKPKTVYRVYLEGESLGLIESKESLEKYIDNQQEKIKEKYNVDKVYPPKDLDIIQETTFKDDYKTSKEIYNEIADLSAFTIDGYIITIKGVDIVTNVSKTEGKDQDIYTLDKKIFEEAVDNVLSAFVSAEDIDTYVNKTQTEIDDVGKIIENIYIENQITIQKGNIPVDEKIYEEEEELSKYLLFGTTKEQKTYKVKEGDTIEDIAFNNKMSTEEFLVANPEFKDENSLLFPGQTVTLGQLFPQFNIVEEEHVVKLQDKPFKTITELDDSKYEGQKEVTQKGVAGEEIVTQKVKKVNGSVFDTITISTEEIKPSVPELVIEGTKESNSYYSGPMTVVPTKGDWAWPASCSNISSPFGYRSGILHDAVDISSCGTGSPIYAGQSGTVVESGSKWPNGEYVMIQHSSNYYTIYAHLCSGCRYVKVGDKVSKGQVIGGMGSTGLATGTHLHYGIWSGYPYRGGVPFNPMSVY